MAQSNENGIIMEDLTERLVASFVPDLLRKELSAVLCHGLSSNDYHFAKPHCRTIKGVCLVVDVVGFATAVKQHIACRGNEGLLKYADVTSTFIGSLLHTVYDHGGDVLEISGAMVIAMFATEDISNSIVRTAVVSAMDCAWELKNMTKSELSVRVSIGWGNVSIGLLGGYASNWRFVIAGQVKNQLMQCVQDLPEKTVMVTAYCHVVLSTDAERTSYSAVDVKPEWLRVTAYTPTLTKPPVLGMTKKRMSTRFRAACGVTDERRAPGTKGYYDLITQMYCYLPRPIIHEVLMGCFEDHADMAQVTALHIRMDRFDDVLHNRDLRALQMYLVACQEIVIDVGGYVSQFTVDFRGCVLVVLFGVPTASYHDNVQRAFGAAVRCRFQLQEMKMQSSIAIATSRCICGCIGHESRREYLALGYALDLAGSLASRSKNSIVIDSTTYQMVGERISPSFRLLPSFMAGDGTSVISYAMNLQVEDHSQIDTVVSDALEAVAEFDEVRAVPKSCKAAILHVLKRANSGRTSHHRVRSKVGLVVIEGEAGCGKAEAILYLKRSCANRAMRVVAVKPTVENRAASYSTLAKLFRQMIRDENFDDPVRQKLVVETLLRETYPHDVPQRDKVAYPILCEALGVNTPSTWKSAPAAAPAPAPAPVNQPSGTGTGRAASAMSGLSGLSGLSAMRNEKSGEREGMKMDESAKLFAPSTKLAICKEIIGKVITEQQLVLVIEDAHEVDDASWQVLLSLAESMTDAPSVIVITHESTQVLHERGVMSQNVWGDVATNSGAGSGRHKPPDVRHHSNSIQHGSTNSAISFTKTKSLGRNSSLTATPPTRDKQNNNFHSATASTHTSASINAIIRINPLLLTTSIHDGNFIRVSYDSTLKSLQKLKRKCRQGGKDGHGEHVILTNISEQETTVRFAVMLEVEPSAIDPALAAAAFQLCGGHPFWLGEMMAYILEFGMEDFLLEMKISSSSAMLSQWSKKRPWDAARTRRPSKSHTSRPEGAEAPTDQHVKMSNFLPQLIRRLSKTIFSHKHHSLHSSKISAIPKHMHNVLNMEEKLQGQGQGPGTEGHDRHGQGIVTTIAATAATAAATASATVSARKVDSENGNDAGASSAPSPTSPHHNHHTHTHSNRDAPKDGNHSNFSSQQRNATSTRQPNACDGFLSMIGADNSSPSTQKSTNPPPGLGLGAGPGLGQNQGQSPSAENNPASRAASRAPSPVESFSPAAPGLVSSLAAVVASYSHSPQSSMLQGLSAMAGAGAWPGSKRNLNVNSNINSNIGSKSVEGDAITPEGRGAGQTQAQAQTQTQTQAQAKQGEIVGLSLIIPSDPVFNQQTTPPPKRGGGDVDGDHGGGVGVGGVVVVGGGGGVVGGGGGGDHTTAPSGLLGDLSGRLSSTSKRAGEGRSGKSGSVNSKGSKQLSRKMDKTASVFFPTGHEIMGGMKVNSVMVQHESIKSRSCSQHMHAAKQTPNVVDHFRDHPSVVKGIVLSRFSKLSLDEQIIIRIAAVAGAEFRVDVLDRTIPVPVRPYLCTILNALVDGYWLTSNTTQHTSNGSRRLHYSFCHPTVQSTLYEIATDTFRGSTHLKIAEYLESGCSKESIALHGQGVGYKYDLLGAAYHYSLSGMPAWKTVEFLCKACDEFVSTSPMSVVGTETAVKLVHWSTKLVRTIPEVVVVLGLIHKCQGVVEEVLPERRPPSPQPEEKGLTAYPMPGGCCVGWFQGDRVAQSPISVSAAQSVRKVSGGEVGGVGGVGKESSAEESDDEVDRSTGVSATPSLRSVLLEHLAMCAEFARALRLQLYDERIRQSDYVSQVAVMSTSSNTRLMDRGLGFGRSAIGISLSMEKGMIATTDSGERSSPLLGPRGIGSRILKAQKRRSNSGHISNAGVQSFVLDEEKCYEEDVKEADEWQKPIMEYHRQSSLSKR